MFFVNISERPQYFRDRIFAIGSFLIENRIKLKNTRSVFFKFTFLFLRDFLTVFGDFSVSVQYFLKRGLALKFPLTETEYYAYKSASSVESIKLMTIIEAKFGQNGRRSKCATLFALSGLESNYDLYRLQCILKVLLVMSHFKIRTQTL